MMDDEPRVSCYSGYVYAEEPREFIVAGRHYPVEQILARWRTPAGPAFRVRCRAGECILAYHESEDHWTVQFLSEEFEEDGA